MKIISTIFFFISLQFSFAQSDPVSDVIKQIDPLSVVEYVTNLQNLGTRFMLSPKRFEAADYIKNEFESMGFTDVQLDSFQCRTRIGQPYFPRTIDTITTQVNVIATLPGTATPEEIYIICGHYDSFCDNANPFETAPGADDNASGTTAVLESARAIMSSGHQPKSTLRFIAFAAEELLYFGDAGSEHYANEANARNDDIKLVINNDMIGYTDSRPEFSSVNIGYTTGYSNISKVMQLAGDNSSITCIEGGYHGADLLTFTQHGYHGIYFEESIFNTVNYHKSTDIIDNINIQYLTEVIKAATAVLVGIDEQVSGIEGEATPITFSLLQNYPNPFNPTTTIKFSIPSVETTRRVVSTKLIVYDILGREIRSLVNEVKAPGTYEVQFDASNLASGIYFYRLIAGDFVQTRKMILLR